MKIKAWAAMSPKAKLEPYSYEKEISNNEVQVDVKYCSFLKPDIFFIDNFWGDSNYPLVPCNEIFGIVSEVGKNVSNFKRGDFVGIGYQVYSCMKCEYCKVGKEQFCKKQKVIEVNKPGGLANNIIVDTNFAYKIPEKLQRPEYVSLMGYGLTSYSAIKNSELKPGSKVAVLGVGALGHIAVQILSKMGHNVTALSHSKDKKSFLEKLGVDNFVDPLEDADLEEYKGHFDFILVTSYFSYDWKKIIELLSPEGNLCFVGLPDEKISFPAYLLADYARRKVSGNYFGSRTEMKELLVFAQENDIKAEIQEFPVNQISVVEERVRNNSIPYCAVINISGKS